MAELQINQYGCSEKNHAKFVSQIHEKIVLTQKASTGHIKETLLHFSYANLSDYFNKFNHYTSIIAAKKHKALGKKNPSVFHVFRPWAEFFYRYFIRLGFLDGYPGYCYAVISSLYTYVKYAKTKELVLKGQKH